MFVCLRMGRAACPRGRGESSPPLSPVERGANGSAFGLFAIVLANFSHHVALASPSLARFCAVAQFVAPRANAFRGETPEGHRAIVGMLHDLPIGTIRAGL